MRIDITNPSVPSGFYAVDFSTFSQTMEEADITFSCDMGGGVTVHYGTRDGSCIWLLDNPLGSLYGIWIEANEHTD